MWSIQRRHCQWPWTTPNLVFKISPFFDTEYLTNGYRYGNIYYKRKIVNRTQAFEWHQFQWLWVSSNHDFKVTILLNVKKLEISTRCSYIDNGVNDYNWLTIICVQKWGFWGFWGWRCDNIVFWPPKGTTLREYESVDVLRDKIGTTAWAQALWGKNCVQRKKQKNWVVTLAIWGEITPGAMLTRCRLFGDMVDIITWAIFSWLSVKGCGCGDRGKFAFCYWLDASPLQHWSYYRVTVWFEGHADALDVLCAQLTRDLFAIAKLLFFSLHDA